MALLPPPKGAVDGFICCSACVSMIKHSSTSQSVCLLVPFPPVYRPSPRAEPRSRLADQLADRLIGGVFCLPASSPAASSFSPPAEGWTLGMRKGCMGVVQWCSILILIRGVTRSDPSPPSSF